MNLAVVGSRGINSRIAVESAIIHSPFAPDAGANRWDITIISGGADGVDTLAENFANEYNIDTEILDPNWDDWSNGHPAKYRNTKIVEMSDAVVAVWDGHSNGTRDTIDKTLDRGKPIYVEVVE